MRLARSLHSVITLLWGLSALWLTFTGPFEATGNGYFGTWLGFACALAFAWQEFY